MINELINILGERFGDYPFLATVLACFVFIYIVNICFSIIYDILSRIGGYK